jgi:transposase
VDLESLLPEDHRARSVWAYVEGLDLTPLYHATAVVDGEAGRSATDLKLLLALWLYATVDGVGSARALDRLCTTHVAYQWLCGGAAMTTTPRPAPAPPTVASWIPACYRSSKSV